MLTAIYIEDGIVQLVLTPENKFEKEAIASFKDGKLQAQIFNGAFYDCRGGWVRQRDWRPTVGIGHISDDRSLIIRMDSGAYDPNDDI